GAALPVAGALNPDAAAVRFDDELAEGEAEPRAPRARHVWILHALELAEDHLVILAGDSRPVVGDGEQDPIAVAPRRQLKRHRGRRVRERVLNEVAEHALEQRLVRLEYGSVVGDVHDGVRAFLLKADSPLV